MTVATRLLRPLGALSAALLALSGSVMAAPTSFLEARTVNNAYEYVVVGSGPGGGPLAANLARAGHSVLLIEAGDDQSSNLNSAIPQLFPFGYVDPTLRWDFFVRHYSDDARTLRHRQLVWRQTDGQFWVGPGTEAPAGAEMLGIYYPRGGTLGGSSATNAMGSVLPSDSDWQAVVDLTGDTTWSPANMRQIFQQIERNHYLSPGTSGHGFDGWFDTNAGNASGYAPYTNVLEVMKSVASGLGQDPNAILGHLASDINQLDPNRDQTQGVHNSAVHATAAWRRFSSRDYILETANAQNPDGSKKYPLYLSLNTLATKVLFERATGRKPRAYGVKYLKGQSLYSADPRHDSAAAGEPGIVHASREIIVAAGAINTPQLLKLSGIGPAAELASFNICTIVDLPGVGANLQDNYEVPIVATFNDTFAIPPDPNAPACTFGAPGDPCVDLWLQGQGPYMSFGNLNGCLRKTTFPALGERDHFFTAGTFAIRGFRPPAANMMAFDPPNTFALSTVKMHAANRAGTVKLRSADPRDTPAVNFNFFADGPSATLSPSQDLLAIGDTIKWARRQFAAVGGTLSPAMPVEPPCPPGASPSADGSCDDAADREWVMDQAFGHHATSSAAIGAESDPLAVLDSEFRVRGTAGLRVVDASAFPVSPGAFPVLPTFMLSEKASMAILEEL